MTKIKICLDAGHYGKYNRSNVVPAYYESDMNWKLHLLLKKYLEEYGIEVITTRADKDKDMDLYARGKASEGSNLLLSLHSNDAERESADYPLAIVPVDSSGNDIGKKLAECIRDVMDTNEPASVSTKPTKDGKNNWYGVIHGAALVGVTGIILEHSFHSNKRSAQWLSSDANLDRLAQAEADIIAAHYGVKKTAPKPAPKLEETPVANDYILGMDYLRKGDKGEAVKALQILLIGRGYSCGGAGADGDFGTATDTAVRAFQKKNGLTVDGVVGKGTMSELLGI